MSDDKMPDDKMNRMLGFSQVFETALLGLVEDGGDQEEVGSALLHITLMFIEKRYGLKTPKETADWLRGWADKCEQQKRPYLN